MYLCVDNAPMSQQTNTPTSLSTRTHRSEMFWSLNLCWFAAQTQTKNQHWKYKIQSGKFPCFFSCVAVKTPAKSRMPTCVCILRSVWLHIESQQHHVLVKMLCAWDRSTPRDLELQIQCWFFSFLMHAKTNKKSNAIKTKFLANALANDSKHVYKLVWRCGTATLRAQK